MDFFEVPTIPALNIYRAARVSSGKGCKVMQALTEKGLVQPVRTPTGRLLFTPKDGMALFQALTAA